MKKVLVTGGSGFIGRKLVHKILSTFPDVEVTSVSRSECHISQLMTACPDGRLKISMGDIRDADAMKYFARDKDTVIHLAAMKRVDTCEEEVSAPVAHRGAVALPSARFEGQAQTQLVRFVLLLLRRREAGKSARSDTRLGNTSALQMLQCDMRRLVAHNEQLHALQEVV